MNRRHARLATAATAILLAACSSSPDSPPPFEEAPADLAARLAADLGVPTYVEMKDGATFILPRGQTRAIAASARKGEDVAGWLQKYSADLGVGPLHDVTEGRDAAGTTHVRMGTRLPDTIDAPAFGLEAMLDAEGRLLGVIGREPPRDLAVSPKVTKEQAAATAATEGAAEGEAASEPVLTVYSDSEKTRLAYRIDRAGDTVWIDAETSTTLLVAARERHAMVSALSSEHYFEEPRRRTLGKTRSIEVTGNAPPYSLVRPARFLQGSRIEVSSFVGFDANGRPRKSAPLESFVPEVWDVGTPAMDGSSRGDGSAVDAAYNAALVDDFFFRMVRRGPSADGVIRIAAHRNWVNPTTEARDDARFDPRDATVYFGDGEGGYGEQDFDRLSMAVALDGVAHELTHQFMASRPTTFPELAYEEGFADVVGQMVEHDHDPQGKETRGDRFAERSFVGGGGRRNLAHPELKLAGSMVFGDITLDFRAPACAPPKGKSSRVFDPKDGCYYLDSQVTSYAWHLMTFGGVHPKSHIEISKGIGWDSSRLLWLSLLGPTLEVNAQGTLRAIPTTEPVVAAKRQIMLARALGAEVLEKVTCAWTAAGVLGEWEAFMATGVSCVHAQSAYCANKPDGVYCDPIRRNASFRCKGRQNDAAPAPCGQIGKKRRDGQYETDYELCATQDGFAGHAATLVGGAPLCVNPHDDRNLSGAQP